MILERVALITTDPVTLWRFSVALMVIYPEILEWFVLALLLIDPLSLERVVSLSEILSLISL